MKSIQLSVIAKPADFEKTVIGTLTSEEYEQICSQARRDWRIYAAVSLGFLKAAINWTLQAVRLLPFAFFFILFVWAYTDANSVTLTLSEAAKNPAQAVEAFVNSVVLVFVLCLLSSFIALGFRGNHDYLKPYHNAIDLALEAKFNLPRNMRIVSVAESIEDFVFRTSHQPQLNALAKG